MARRRSGHENMGFLFSETFSHTASAWQRAWRGARCCCFCPRKTGKPVIRCLFVTNMIIYRMLWQMMKRICRKIGMPRWPYREIDSINKAMEDLRSLLAGAKTEADRARCGFRCDLWFGGPLSIDCRSGAVAQPEAGRLAGRYFLHAWIRPTMPCILLSGAFLRR